MCLKQLCGKHLILGIGYVVIVPPAQVGRAQQVLAGIGIESYVIGEVTPTGQPQAFPS